MGSIFNIKRLPHSEGIPLPKYQTDGSAGIDLPAAIEGSASIDPGARLLIPTGFAFSIPRNYEGQIRSRSGLALKYGVTVLNSPGTIDSDYRGEVSVLLINQGSKTFFFERGDRIAQMVFTKIEQVKFQEVKALDKSDRGLGGYGSTGLSKSSENSVS
ncbi:MAG: dUTP diphosphatase [Rhodospirillaceae bacterium]|nr:dUTP diphosphatase [Rhodospirillaceae bacterium]